MKLRPVERTDKDPDAPDFIFWCPGCKCGHGVWTTHPNGVTGATWKFNGNMEAPTFEPSLLIKHVKLPPVDPETGDFKKVDGKYLMGPDGRIADAKEFVCHTVITNGIINFEGDCTHELAGKKVPLEDF